MQATHRTIVLLSLAALTSCSKPPAPAGPQAPRETPQPPAAAIEWFSGTIDQAFAQAASENKPVFLYWGADWCPPCKQLKATVLRRPEFIARTRLVVPVFVDGDAEGAQKIGDEFKVTGYPTVVILQPDREEITRIAGGLDLNRYATVLDDALGETRPVAQVLSGLKSATELGAAECGQLAYHGWGLEDNERGAMRLRALQLAKAATLCPPPATLDRARLKVLAAFHATAGQGQSPTPDALPSVEAVAQILRDGSVQAGLADVLQLLGRDFFAAAKPLDSAPRARFLADWGRTMTAFAEDRQRTPTDRLIAVRSRIIALQALEEDAALIEAAAEQARQRVEAAVALKVDSFEHSGIVNAALNVLDALGDTERMYQIADQERATSKHAYYYMSTLAELDERAGRLPQALRWYEWAYRQSQGSATRFQWGYEWLAATMRLTPDNATRIQQAGMEVLAELDGPDRIYRRTRLRLEKLDRELREWAGRDRPRLAALRALRGQMRGICGKLAAGDTARVTCDRFLARHRLEATQAARNT